MRRVRPCPKISRDEEPAEHIRQVEQGGDYALSKRNVLAGWEGCLAERETWQSTYSSCETDGAIRLPKLFQVPDTGRGQCTLSNRIIFCKPCEKCIHDERHKIGPLTCVRAFESHSSFMTIVGTSMTAGPSTSASMTPR